MNFHYRCLDCGTEYDNSVLRYRCPVCAAAAVGSRAFQAGNLEVLYDAAELRSIGSSETFSQFDFFPYPIQDYSAYPVGNTPLIRSQRLSRSSGITNLRFKNDGANPSGSFKDRASQLIAAQAIAHGQRRVVVASTGNAGSAMACAGAAYGLEIILFVPETAPVNKLIGWLAIRDGSVNAGVE